MNSEYEHWTDRLRRKQQREFARLYLPALIITVLCFLLANVTGNENFVLFSVVPWLSIGIYYTVKSL